MPARFEGKVAFVTGAASGIGRDVALGFGAEGAKVVVTDVAEAGEQTAAAITQVGGQARFIRCDVTDVQQVRAAIDATVAAYGRLDCAFNNAGVFGQRAHVHEYPEEEF